MLLAHTVRGSGPAILLLHASVADSRMWQAQVEALAGDVTVVAPDLRGFGESPLPAEEYSDAGDLVTLLDELGIDRVAVVGSSYGGRVALQLAALAPERVRRLVLLNCAPAGVEVERTADLREFAEQENALLEDGDVAGATELNVRTWLGPEASDEARALLHDMQLRAFQVQMAAGDEVRASEVPVDLAAIPARTTVVTGGQDLEFFRAVGRALAAALPAAELVELPWAGHLPTLERPDEGTSILRRALQDD